MEKNEFFAGIGLQRTSNVPVHPDSGGKLHQQEMSTNETKKPTTNVQGLTASAIAPTVWSCLNRRTPAHPKETAEVFDNKPEESTWTMQDKSTVEPQKPDVITSSTVPPMLPSIPSLNVPSERRNKRKPAHPRRCAAVFDNGSDESTGTVQDESTVQLQDPDVTMSPPVSSMLTTVSSLLDLPQAKVLSPDSHSENTIRCAHNSGADSSQLPEAMPFGTKDVPNPLQMMTRYPIPSTATASTHSLPCGGAPDAQPHLGISACAMQTNRETHQSATVPAMSTTVPSSLDLPQAKIPGPDIQVKTTSGSAHTLCGDSSKLPEATPTGTKHVPNPPRVTPCPATRTATAPTHSLPCGVAPAAPPQHGNSASAMQASQETHQSRASQETAQSQASLQQVGGSTCATSPTLPPPDLVPETESDGDVEMSSGAADESSESGQNIPGKQFTVPPQTVAEESQPQSPAVGSCERSIKLNEAFSTLMLSTLEFVESPYYVEKVMTDISPPKYQSAWKEVIRAMAKAGLRLHLRDNWIVQHAAEQLRLSGYGNIPMTVIFIYLHQKRKKDPSTASPFRLILPPTFTSIYEAYELEKSKGGRRPQFEREFTAIDILELQRQCSKGSSEAVMIHPTTGRPFLNPDNSVATAPFPSSRMRPRKRRLEDRNSQAVATTVKKPRVQPNTAQVSIPCAPTATKGTRVNEPPFPRPSLPSANPCLPPNTGQVSIPCAPTGVTASQGTRVNEVPLPSLPPSNPCPLPVQYPGIPAGSSIAWQVNKNYDTENRMVTVNGQGTMTPQENDQQILAHSMAVGSSYPENEKRMNVAPLVTSTAQGPHVVFGTPLYGGGYPLTAPGMVALPQAVNPQTWTSSPLPAVPQGLFQPEDPGRYVFGYPQMPQQNTLPPEAQSAPPAQRPGHQAETNVVQPILYRYFPGTTQSPQAWRGPFTAAETLSQPQVLQPPRPEDQDKRSNEIVIRPQVFYRAASTSNQLGGYPGAFQANHMKQQPATTNSLVPAMHPGFSVASSSAVTSNPATVQSAFSAVTPRDVSGNPATRHPGFSVAAPRDVTGNPVTMHPGFSVATSSAVTSNPATIYPGFSVAMPRDVTGNPATGYPTYPTSAMPDGRPECMLPPLRPRSPGPARSSRVLQARRQEISPYVTSGRVQVASTQVSNTLVPSIVVPQTLVPQTLPNTLMPNNQVPNPQVPNTQYQALCGLQRNQHLT